MGIESIPSLLNGIGAAGRLLERYLPEIPGFEEVLGGAKENVTVDIAPEYRDLLEQQMEMQTQLQEVTFLSNIERTAHEIRMAPVRNIRLG